MDPPSMVTWTDLLDKLPDEIVETILSYLESPQDLSSVTKTSSVCGSILHSKKTIFLFHEILPCVAPYLEKADLLNFRLTSHPWKAATDNFLETSELFNDETYFRRNSPFWPRRSRTITDFLNTMQFHKQASPKINPFPGRRAAFGRIRREAPPFDYWFNVLLLLSEFGAELWDCRLDFDDIPFERFVTVLCDCLANLPMLKRLQIVYFGRPSSTTSDSSWHVIIMRNMFPRLQQLQHLELNGTFPRDFYQNIVVPHYSTNLNTLKLHEVLPEGIHLINMPQLRTLRVSAASSSDIARAFPQDSSHLTNISISTYLPDQPGFNKLFDDLLHRYHPTLKSLEIFFETRTTTKAPPQEPWSHPLLHTFPSLRLLKLKNAPVQLLDSLENFPSLEYLEVECLEKDECFLSPGKNMETCGLFKICGYAANQLYSSNIWEILPCLRSCRLSCYQLFSGRELNYNYSRARYDYLQKDKL